MQQTCIKYQLSSLYYWLLDTTIDYQQNSCIQQTGMHAHMHASLVYIYATIKCMHYQVYLQQLQSTRLG